MKFYEWEIRFFVLDAEWQGSKTWRTELSAVEWEPPRKKLERIIGEMMASGLFSRVWAVGPGGQVECDQTHPLTHGEGDCRAD